FRMLSLRLSALCSTLDVFESCSPSYPSIKRANHTALNSMNRCRSQFRLSPALAVPVNPPNLRWCECRRYKIVDPHRSVPDGSRLLSISCVMNSWQTHV